MRVEVEICFDFFTYMKIQQPKTGGLNKNFKKQIIIKSQINICDDSPLNDT